MSSFSIPTLVLWLVHGGVGSLLGGLDFGVRHFDSRSVKISFKKLTIQDPKTMVTSLINSLHLKEDPMARVCVKSEKAGWRVTVRRILAQTLLAKIEEIRDVSPHQ
jgi:hypothetical protein